MPLVCVSMPYWRTPETVRRAVSSVLAQTHRDLVLVVLNDADDPSRAWAPLDGISDPRLVPFDLRENRGWPFADAVALAACDAEYFCPHDSDDWSDPRRLEMLLALAPGADVVLQDQIVIRRNGSSVTVPVVNPRAGDTRLRHLSVRAGLYRVSWLRAVGGVNPSFRLGYDTLLTSLAFLAGVTRIVRQPIYHRVQRPDSLTATRETGLGSPMRLAIRARLEELWRQCLEAVQNRDDRAAAVGEIIRRSIAPEDAAAVEREAARLRALLAERQAA